MAKRPALILQLRITAAELQSILNPDDDVIPVVPPKTVLAPKPYMPDPDSDMQHCGWCTLPIRGVPLGIPVRKDLKTGEFSTTHAFHHRRCVAAGAQYHYRNKIDEIMKLFRDFYGPNIMPADPKEVMSRYTPGGISDEEYELRLNNGTQITRVVWPPLVSPLTGEIFNMDLRS